LNNIILKKFEKYLLIERNCSLKTIRAYIDDIILFLDFLKKFWKLNIEINEINIFILSQVKEKTIYAYLVYLNYYRYNTAASRQRRISALKTFYKFLYNKYYPTFQCCTAVNNISPITLVVRLPKYLNLEQAKQIQNVFNLGNSSNPLRNNTIISVFLHTGIRLSELVNLSIADFDLNKDEQFIKIRVKGNKETSVFFSKFIMDKIKRYLKTRKDTNNALFISNRNERISIDAVADICKKAFKLIGITDKKYSTHSLRHTAAVLIYTQTKDLLVTKEFLNHSNICSTEIYAHVEDESIRNAVNSNPLAHFKI
jgi:site-specific recombinase XerD